MTSINGILTITFIVTLVSELSPAQNNTFCSDVCRCSSEDEGLNLVCNATSVFETIVSFSLEHTVTVGRFTLINEESFQEVNTEYFRNDIWNYTSVVNMYGRNRIKHWGIKGQSLEYFRSVKVLRLQYVGLEYIRYGSFRFLGNLEHLDLSGNFHLRFEDVTAGIQGFKSTAFSVFNMSRIHSLENYFQYDFNHDFLREMSSTNLQVLDISWTRLGDVTASMYYHVPNLVAINVSGTFFRGPSVCAGDAVKMKNLTVIEANDWPKFPTVTNGLISRRGIEVHESCNFTASRTLDGSLKLPPALQSVYFRRFDAASFYIPFSGIRFEHNNSVVTLVLTELDLGTIRVYEGLFGLHKLEHFEIQDSGIGHVNTTAFSDMPSLSYLDISGNELYRNDDETLSNLFAKNSKLQKLDMSNNDLTQLPREMLMPNNELVFLNLSYNSISTLDLEFRNLQNFRILDISQNPIVSINSEFLVDLNSIAEVLDTNEPGSFMSINLSGNAFQCDCKSLTFLEDLISLHDRILLEQGSLTCLLESKRKVITREYIVELKGKCEESYLVYVGIGLGVFGFLLISGLLLFYLLRRRKIKYTTSQDIVLGEIDPDFICFLVFAGADQEFAYKKIRNPLENCLRRVFDDQENVIFVGDENFEIGKYIAEEIVKAVDRCWTVVPVISNNFLGSGWCKLEIRTAWEKGRMILPLFIEECDRNRFTGLFSHIYNHYTRSIWPRKRSEMEDELTDDEQAVIESMSKTITTFVQNFRTVNKR